MNTLPMGTEVWVVSGIGGGIKKGIVVSDCDKFTHVVYVKFGEDPQKHLCNLRDCHTSLRSASEHMNKLIDEEIEILEPKLKILKDLKRLNDEVIAIETKLGR